MVTLYTPYHSMTAHFGAAFPFVTSAIIILAVIYKSIGREDLTKKLTFPIRVMLLISLLSIMLACAGALIDFPPSAFIASPFFSLKTTFAIITFFIYTGLYYTFKLKEESIWESQIGIIYVAVLALAGMFTVSVLGAIGGYLGKGHTVLEFVLKFFGLT